MMMNNINWYPGHMKKTRELIIENLKLVDMLIEVIDARIPVSSRNPILDEIASNKRRFIVLNKSDLANAADNERWVESFRLGGFDAVALNSMSGDGVKEFLKTLGKIQDERNKKATIKRPLRLMIAGVPNVGKSSLINRLTGRKSAQTGNKPGVTRGKQWLAIANGMQLLDTPGILWPKFEDPMEGINLALCGSIKDEILNIEDLALKLIGILVRDYPGLLTARYGIDIGGSEDGQHAIAAEKKTYQHVPEDSCHSLVIMESIAQKRGFVLSGGRCDYLRTARTLLDEFRCGLLGQITLERL